MKAKTELSDFTFKVNGSGSYRVYYTSPVTFRTWAAVINTMPLIDATKNSDRPKRKDLDWLKALVKRSGVKITDF